MNKTTVKKMTAAARKIIKSAARVDKRSGRNTALLYTVDGRSVVCDSYRALRYPADLPDLPHAEYNDFGRSAAALMDHDLKGCTVSVPLPSVDSIKQAISEKQKHIPLGPVHVNPKYLLDMVQAIPDADARINPRRGDISPIYFRDIDGADGLLMPVRVG